MTEARNKIVQNFLREEPLMLSMNLCLFKRNKVHGIEGMFDKMDELQPGTQRYHGASCTTSDAGTYSPDFRDGRVHVAELQIWAQCKPR